MAHALFGYDGPCKNIHGHSYQLSVTVVGKTITDSNDPKHGMIMDFTDLKKIITDAIIAKHDHALVLNRNSPHKDFEKNTSLFEKIILVDYQPTCENLLIDFASTILDKLPKNIQLHHLTLKETPNSYAEWYAKDNQQ